MSNEDSDNTLHSHDHPGFDPDRLIEMESRRRAMLPPEDVLGRFLSRNDSTLLDLGCGAGFFAIPAAKILSEGKVYAADLQQNMIDTTLRRAQEARLSNVEGVAAPSTNLPVAGKSIDVVLMSMVFHDIDEKEATLTEVGRVLKSTGILFMIEMDRVDGGFGPPMSIRISPDELTGMLRAAGFSAIETTFSPQQEGIYFVRAKAPTP